MHAEGWHRDPFGGELVRNADGVDEVWGRGAVDMLNLTASMAVAFRDVVERGVRPRGDLLYFAVADEEAGSAHGARWVAEHHPDAIRCDYVLTESGGLHDGTARRAGRSASPSARRAWRGGGCACAARPATARCRSASTTRSSRRPPSCSGWPTTGRRRGSTSCGRPVSSRCSVPDELKAALLDPPRIDEALDALPSAAAAAHLHACTHTTFSPNLIDGGVMKTNVIPDSVSLDVDVRTLPGEGTDEVTAHLRAALGDLADHVEIEILLDDPASISRTDTPLWDTLAAGRRRCRSRGPGWPRSSPSASPTPGCSASSARRRTAPGCSARRSTPPSSVAGSTATTSASTSSRSGLTVELWRG